MNMKIRYVLFLLLISNLAGTIYSQGGFKNQQKYWFMRQRLNEKFVKVGPDHGESLPAGAYQVVAEGQWNNTTDINKKIYWGSETPGRMGYYIGVLATEIKLLRDKGEDYSNTVMELYYALNAIDRLDDYGEIIMEYQPESARVPDCDECSFWSASGPLGIVEWDPVSQHWLPKDGSEFTSSNSRNGYYARTDIPADFLSNFPDANMMKGGLSRPWRVDNGYDGCYFGGYSTNPDEINYQAYGSDETSQDQTFGLLMGLKLVKQFVPSDVTYNGEGLRAKGIQIANRLIDLFGPDQIFYSPITNSPFICSDGSNANSFAASMNSLRFDFLYDQPNEVNSQVCWPAAINTPCLHSDWNFNDEVHAVSTRNLYALVASIANTTTHEYMCNYVTTDGFDWGFYYLLRQALYPHGADGGCDYELNEVIEDLSDCPCRGPHLDQYEWTEDGSYKTGNTWHQYTFAEMNSNTTSDWFTPNRWDAACKEIWGVETWHDDNTWVDRNLKLLIAGEFVGLDYMLLFNLANIVHGDGYISGTYTDMRHYYFTAGGPLFPLNYHPVGFIDMTTDVKLSVGTNVDAKAANFIEILPGFEAPVGSIFSAEIKDGQWTCVDEIYKKVPFVPVQVRDSLNRVNRPDLSESSTTTLEEEKGIDQFFTCYPNPTYSTVTISCNSKDWNDIISVKFIDINGKEVFSTIGTCNQPVDISSFNQGYYNMVLEYTVNGGLVQENFKIIKL